MCQHTCMHCCAESRKKPHHIITLRFRKDVIVKVLPIIKDCYNFFHIYVQNKKKHHVEKKHKTINFTIRFIHWRWLRCQSFLFGWWSIWICCCQTWISWQWYGIEHFCWYFHFSKCHFSKRTLYRSTFS